MLDTSGRWIHRDTLQVLDALSCSISHQGTVGEPRLVKIAGTQSVYRAAA